MIKAKRGSIVSSEEGDFVMGDASKNTAYTTGPMGDASRNLRYLGAIDSKLSKYSVEPSMKILTPVKEAEVTSPKEQPTTEPKKIKGFGLKISNNKILEAIKLHLNKMI